MANAFMKLWDNVVNKPAQSFQKDVKELRNQQFNKDIKAEQQKQKNQQEWNKYLNKGKAIDYNDFDAKVVDLPKENENEKQIQINRQPKIASSGYIDTGVKDDDNELEMLAGNGIPEKPEQKNQSFTLDNKIDDEDNELEMLAGNGIKLPPPEEQNEDTIAPEGEEEDSEPSVEIDDNADGIDREDLFDEEADFPDILSDEEVEQIEKDAREEEARKKEEEKETADTEKTDSKKTTKETKNGSSKESKSESKTEKTKSPSLAKQVLAKKLTSPKSPGLAKQALANALTDKAGLSVSDMVENVNIPHYNYLSLFK